MSSNPPIIILGFGRSGTTWVSDIISKSIGQLILFEPFHPCVFSESKHFCYRAIANSDEEAVIKSHLNEVLEKRIDNRWLLRNHLNTPLEEIEDSFVSYIWDNSLIAGFKSIRLNFNIPWFYSSLKSKPVFIIRHPLAVISSVLRRKRFFEEFGWSFHWDNFAKNSAPLIEPKQYLRKIFDSCSTTEEKLAYMWCVTNIICLKQLSGLGLSPFFYEKIYADPYFQAKNMLDSIGLTRDIHPSYLFTPSMLTLRTIHPFSGQKKINDTPELFWENYLNEEQIESINRTIGLFLPYNQRFMTMVEENNYLSAV